MKKYLIFIMIIFNIMITGILKSNEVLGQGYYLTFDNIIENGDFSDLVTTGWAVGGSTLENTDEYLKIIQVVPLTSWSTSYNIDFDDHIYYSSFYINNLNSITDFSYALRDSVIESFGESIPSEENNQWINYSYLTSNDDYNGYIRFMTDTINASVFAIDNVIFIDLTVTFGAGNEPSLEQLESDYMSKMPSYFETYNFLLTDILVANQGDLVVGTVTKEDFLKDYSYMYLAYKQPYTTINILATEDVIINDCKAEFLFQNDWFDLNANIDTCELDDNNPNYYNLLGLLQDGVVKSDLVNDTYFSISYTNEDYTERTTQILISFDEVVQSIRTVIFAFGDNMDINDFNEIAFQFKYDGYIVGYQENAISYLWEDNVIVLTIYNTLLKYDSLNIFIQQSSAEYNTTFALTELAFLKDTLISIPIATRNIEAESDFLLDFSFQYEVCGTWDFGCKLKNVTIWLTVESPPAVTMWEKYGELSNKVYDITRIQNDFTATLDSTGIQVGLGAIVTLITAMTSIMIYSLFMKFFR